MSTTLAFGAPRGRTLKLTTILCLFICFSIPVIGLINYSAFPGPLRWTLMLFPLLIVAGAAPFMVRGYTVTDGAVIIHRLGWSYHLELASLLSVEADPSAMKGSIRLAGNGGLFAFCGWFRNSKLGVYRAFCTDVAHAVVLRFPDRTVVVTPDQPEKFVQAVKELK
jgi:hypothetical protein